MQRRFDTNVRLIWEGESLEDNGYFGDRANLAKVVQEALRERPIKGGIPAYNPKARWLPESEQFEVEFLVGRDPAIAVIAACCEATLRRLSRFGIRSDSVWRIEALSVAAE